MSCRKEGWDDYGGGDESIDVEKITLQSLDFGGSEQELKVVDIREKRI